MANVTAKEQDKIESYHSASGGLKGYELSEELSDNLNKSKKGALKLLKAKVPKGGVFPVVADGILTDLFVHEALGHAAEADHLIQKETCLEGLQGKKIAPEFVNIYDDATISGSWGSYFYDDEGIPAQKTLIIKNGVLNSFLHSRETAANLKQKPTGNARAQSVNHIPIVRMSNTYIDKGRYKFEELIEDIKHGFYLKGGTGGQVDTAKGSFQFAAQEGYIIENGELKGLLKGVSLSGNTLEILKNISRVSNKFEKGFPGHCGKDGQHVPVIGSCPSIFISKAMVGGR